jgi:hypothetical protein
MMFYLLQILPDAASPKRESWYLSYPKSMCKDLCSADQASQYERTDRTVDTPRCRPVERSCRGSQ